MKYVGSKNKISKYIIPILQKVINDNNIDTYIEPFVGGANVIDKIKCENKIGYDKNEYLIALLNAIKEGYIPPKDMTKEEYTLIKNNMSLFPKKLVGVAGFCATYNGGWMRRYGGKAQTKSGKIRNYYDESVRNLLAQSKNLLGVQFLHSEFQDINIEENCVIYCDPPYINSSYEMYQGDFPYELYYEWVKQKSKNNVVVCSEYWMPDDFVSIWEMEVRMSLDNKNSKQNRVEKLFVHKDSLKYFIQ